MRGELKWEFFPDPTKWKPTSIQEYQPRQANCTQQVFGENGMARTCNEPFMQNSPMMVRCPSCQKAATARSVKKSRAKYKRLREMRKMA